MLRPAAPSQRPGQWLQQLCGQWRESGLPWDACCRSWAQAENLHSGQDILRELDARFDAGQVSYGPYFFPDLAKRPKTMNKGRHRQR